MKPGAVSVRSSSGRGSSAAPVVGSDMVNAGRLPVSSGVFPADLNGLRRRFPSRWAGFLRAHFSGPPHVAVFFSVDDRTARDWWSGKHGVNSAPVIFAMRAIPGAVAELLEAA